MNKIKLLLCLISFLILAACTSNPTITSTPSNAPPEWVTNPQASNYSQQQGYLVGLGQASVTAANYEREAYVKALADLNQQLATQVSSECTRITTSSQAFTQCQAKLTSQLISAKPKQLAVWQDAATYYLLLGKLNEN